MLPADFFQYRFPDFFRLQLAGMAEDLIWLSIVPNLLTISRELCHAENS